MSSFIPETKGTGAYVHDDDRNSKQICCICESNEPNAKIRSAATLPRAELVLRKEPCPFCRRPIEGFDVGKWSSVIGEHGLWPTSLVNLRNLASGEGFNEYFQQMFDGNEKAYERWQSTFDRLGILKEIKDEGSGVEMETQVFIILNSNDMAKLRAVEQICHQDYFHDSTLLVVARRRILDVLMMADPAGEEAEGERVKVRDSQKLEILDAMAALGRACAEIRNFTDARHHYHKAKEGYEQHLPRNNEKVFEVTYHLVIATVMSNQERIDRISTLVASMKEALGEENLAVLQISNSLGDLLMEMKTDPEKCVEAVECARLLYLKVLSGREKLLGSNNKYTLMTVNNLGNTYYEIAKANPNDGHYEIALAYYQRSLNGKMKLLGDSHPETLGNCMNIAVIYNDGMQDYENAFKMYWKSLRGYESQLGKDNNFTKNCARNFCIDLKNNGTKEELLKLKRDYPWVEDVP